MWVRGAWQGRGPGLPAGPAAPGDSSEHRLEAACWDIPPVAHVQWCLSSWSVGSLRAGATSGLHTNGTGPHLGCAVSGRNPLRPLEKTGPGAAVALLAAAGNAQHPFVGQCSWTWGTLCLPSPSPPLPVPSATPTPTCQELSVQSLKSLKRENLIGCQLAKGRVNREPGGP